MSTSDCDAQQSDSLLVTMRFCGLGHDRTLPRVARLRRIDATHGNTCGFWKTNLSSVVYPNDAQIAMMESASTLVDEEATLTMDGDCLVATVAMPSTAVAVLDFDLTYRNGAMDTTMHI